ncbi:MAG: nucleoid-structuring protein H-NS [Bacteroidota bacterium]
MNSFRNTSGVVVLAFFILISAAGCKSKKKAMEAAAAEKARMEQEATRKKQLEEEARMKEAEEKARMEAEANAKKEADMKAAAASTPKAKLSQYFDAIAGSSSTGSANSSINEALTLFASGDTPVLIVISESGGQKDYDKPTTIRTYLNYLKDQKKNINRIETLQLDSSGKITEVELRKN